MNTVLVILSVVGAIIVLPLIVALFIKKTYAIKRDVVVNRPLGDVFEYVRMLRNQDHFSKWVMADPHKKVEHRGDDGIVGFVYAWNGNKESGEGEQEIIGLEHNKKVDIEVRFVRPFQSTARTPFTLQRISQVQTKVTWGMEGRSKYPLNLMSLFIKGVLEKDLDTSLNNLKNNLEGINAPVGTPIG